MNLKNQYEIDGDIVRIIIVRLSGEKIHSLISLDSLKVAKEFEGTWGVSINNSTGSFYVTSKLNGKTVYLHRWITKPTEGMVVDHINNDTTDNRIENLRLCRQVENAQNRKGINKNNISGLSGVSWYNPGKKWRAYIVMKNKQMHLGYFENKHDANNAVIEAKCKYMPFSKEATMAKSK